MFLFLLPNWYHRGQRGRWSRLRERALEGRETAVDILIVAGVVSIAGIILSVFLAGRQIGLAARQIGVATTALSEDREEREAQREQRRTALEASLQAEVQAIHSTADADLNDFEGHNASHPRAKQNPSARAVEGETRYWFSFPWTPLPDAAIVEAIREAGLMGLTTAQIQKLQALRTRILRINALVQYKANLYPALMLSHIPRHTPDIYADRPWAEDKAANLNNDMKMEVHAVLVDCAEVLKWWEGEAETAQSHGPSHPGRRPGRTQRAGRWRIVAAARKWISKARPR